MVVAALRKWWDLGSEWVWWSSTREAGTECWQHKWPVLCTPWRVETWHSSCQSFLQWPYLLYTGKLFHLIPLNKIVFQTLNLSGQLQGCTSQKEDPMCFSVIMMMIVPMWKVQELYKKLNLLPYAVHATFQFGGTEGKRHRLREAKHFYDPPEYYNTPGTFFLFPCTSSFQTFLWDVWYFLGRSFLLHLKTLGFIMLHLIRSHPKCGFTSLIHLIFFWTVVIQ